MEKRWGQNWLLLPPCPAGQVLPLTALALRAVLRLRTCHAEPAATIGRLQNW